MGYTQRPIKLTEEILQRCRLPMCEVRVCELGDQRFGSASYAKDAFEEEGARYTAIDISGRNGSLAYDLGKPLPKNLLGQFNVVTNHGTCEHVNEHYWAFRNVHELCEVGGLMIHSMPVPGHWKLKDGSNHSRYAYTAEFASALAKACGYPILHLSVDPPNPEEAGKDRDNVFAVFQCPPTPFITEETFNALPFVDTGDLKRTGDYASPGLAGPKSDNFLNIVYSRKFSLSPLIAWPPDLDFSQRLQMPYLTLLHVLCQRVKPMRVLEIGIRAGYSAHAIMAAAPGAEYVGLDLGRGDDASNIEAVRHARKTLLGYRYRATVLEGDSMDPWPVEMTSKTYQFAHIDGGHQEAIALNDLRKAWPLIEPCGLMVVDDYDCPDVRRAVDAFRAEHADELTIEEYVDAKEGSSIAYAAICRKELISNPYLGADGKIYGRDFFDQGFRETLNGLVEPYQKQDQPDHHQRNRTVLEAIKIKPEDRVLDIGCGLGPVINQVVELLGCRNVTGCDWSDVAIDYCRQQYPFGRFDTVDLADGLPYEDGSFDFVLLFDTTEHLPEPVYQRTMTEARRVLKDGGHIVVLPGLHTQHDHINCRDFKEVAASLDGLGFKYITVVGSAWMATNVKPGAERLLICTRADDSIAEMTALTHPILRAYAKKCRADFVVLDGPSICPVGDGRYHYRILRIRDLLKTYSRVLHLDSDILIRPDCPNLFDVVPPDCIGTINEAVGSRQNERYKTLAQAEAVFGKPRGCKIGLYPNTGVFLVSRQHADIFNPIQGKLWADIGWDDVQMGWQIVAQDHKIAELDPVFNWASMYSEEWNGSKSRFDAFIIHYAGQALFPEKGDRTRLQLMRDDAKHWGLLEGKQNENLSGGRTLQGKHESGNGAGVGVARPSGARVPIPELDSLVWNRGNPCPVTGKSV